MFLGFFIFNFSFHFCQQNSLLLVSLYPFPFARQDARDFLQGEEFRTSQTTAQSYPIVGIITHIGEC